MNLNGASNENLSRNFLFWQRPRYLQIAIKERGRRLRPFDDGRSRHSQESLIHLPTLTKLEPQMTIIQAKESGLSCRRVTNGCGPHYAIFKGDKRLSLSADTQQTARGAWASWLGGCR
jgi:hypothetical protein